MKLNKILMVFAATAIVGCSSEDLNEFSAAQAPEDSRLIQLDPNFALAGVGEGDAITRTHWELTGGSLKNKFLPILTTAYAAGDVLAADVDKWDQSVGLCWLGGTVEEDVYTNYQFHHFGWLKQGASEATLECDKLTNGAWYDEIEFSAAGGAAGEEPNTNDFKWTVAAAADKDFAVTGLNWNSGVYKTENKAIFGGDYVVYYPFDEDFTEVGTIPAKAVTNFGAATGHLTDLYLGDATFRYSNKIHIDGGSKASGFGMYNLSSLVNLLLEGTSGGNVDKIVLWSKKEQLLEQANLAADKIVAGKKGQELYADKKGTKTIVATLATADFSNAAANKTVKTYITALPTTVEDLVVYVHRTDKKWATKTIGSYEFKPNSGQVIHLNVSDGDFKEQYIAVDYASFVTALGEAAGKEATIEIIGDIKLEADLNIDEAKLTIKGDKIIVPEKVTLKVNVKKMESDIDVLGKACCGDATKGGRLEINGGEFNNITMVPAEATVTAATYDDYNPYVTYNGAATIAAGMKFDAQAGNILVNAPVSHKADINIAEGVEVTVSAAGDLNFMGATVANAGTIEVEKNGKFDITDKDGNASATDGKNMTNTGLFIHNVDAQVGTAVQLMNQNGVYRCRVDDQIKLDDAYQKWTACSVIEIVNDGKVYDLGVAEKNINYLHNGKFIDIEVNTNTTTQFSNPTPDDKEIKIGKLSVLQGGLAVNYTNTVGTTTGKRTLTVNGDMVVKGNTALNTSKKINIKQNLTLDGAWLYYQGGKWADGSLKNEALAVTGNITVKGTTFDADDIDALNITCADFTLAGGATAKFGNRTEGDTKNLTASGTITNPDGCTFSIHAANQGTGTVLATITCTKLMVGGAFPGGKPQVVAK